MRNRAFTYSHHTAGAERLTIEHSLLGAVASGPRTTQDNPVGFAPRTKGDSAYQER